MCSLISLFYLYYGVSLFLDGKVGYLATNFLYVSRIGGISKQVDKLTG